MRSGIGSVALDDIMRIIYKVTHAAPVIGFRIATKALPLYRIGDVWSMEGISPRIVFTMGS
jgi:hypothetical protein